MTTRTFSRRKVVAVAGATAVAGLTLSGRVRAATVLLRQQPLALLDGALAGKELVQARSVVASLQARVLESDLVWEWRRDLYQQLAPGRRAIALTRWDKALLLRGLAREAGLAARQRRIAPGLFRTDIG